MGPVKPPMKPMVAPVSCAMAGAAATRVVAAAARVSVFLRLNMYVPLLGCSVERPLLGPSCQAKQRVKGGATRAPLGRLLHISGW